MRKEYKLMKLFQTERCFEMEYSRQYEYWSVLRHLMLRDRKLRFKAKRHPVLPLYLAHAKLQLVIDQPWSRD